MGHTWGAATWIARYEYGYQIGNGFFVAVAALLAAGIRTWYAAGRPVSVVAPGMPLVVRWSLISLFAAALAGLYLWPVR